MANIQLFCIIYFLNIYRYWVDSPVKLLQRPACLSTSSLPNSMDCPLLFV